MGRLTLGNVAVLISDNGTGVATLYAVSPGTTGYREAGAHSYDSGRR
jgi:hypothetical protein